MTFLVVVVGVGVWWYLIGPGANAKNDESSPGRELIVEGGVNAGALGNRSTPTSPLIKERALAFADGDRDGLSEDLEELYGTEPTKSDTDGDGFEDGAEVEHGYEPRNPGKNIRMVDLALVDRIAQSASSPLVVSSGLATSDHERYYFVFNGSTTTYYRADGTVQSQCATATEPTGACATLPNEIRTDFSRSFIDGATSDAYHIPF